VASRPRARRRLRTEIEEARAVTSDRLPRRGRACARGVDSQAGRADPAVIVVSANPELVVFFRNAAAAGQICFCASVRSLLRARRRVRRIRRVPVTEYGTRG
jgi:hypothetical protein